MILSLLYFSCLCLTANAALMATGGTRPLPNFVRPDDNDLRFTDNQIQSIITSYQFTGCGEVTRWRAYVERSGGNHLDVYSATFQVWRPNSPSPVDTDGCYSLVGSNEFSTLPLPDVERSDSGRGRLNGVPPIGETISFQPGDVIGYYLESSIEDDDGIMFAEDDDNSPAYASEEVWSASGTITSGGSSCPFPVGPGGSLTSSTNRAPLISVAIISTPCPVSTSTPVVMASVAPPVTTPPANIGNPPTTMGEAPTGTDGGEGTTPSAAPASDDGVGLVVGFVVVLMVVVLIAVVTVVLIIVLMRRRQRKGDLHGTTALNNPSYEEPIVSTSKSSKFTKRRSKNKAPPLSVNIATGDAAVYESVEGDYHGIPSALDYTYPTPSPTAVRFDRKSETVLIGDKGAYHDQGPDVGNLYDYCGSASGDLEASRSMDGSAVVYEDPTLPKFRRGTNEEDPFDVYGTYVPTLAQRQAMGSHYEYTEGEYSAYNKLQFFVEDQVYWAPADTASDLYQQLASKKYREIPRNQLNILEELGSGQFGTVSKCLWSVSGNALQLAVKTLKPLAPEDDKVKFLQEAAIMGQFLHPNVIKLYGVVTMGQPAMICLEIMSNGDLRSYLKDLNLKAKSFKDTQIMFLRFAKEIAAGMNYLSSKAFVHRDLAARNVLVNENLTCKIGDFGMARDLMDDTYYTSKGGKIPVKWTSPEALLYKKYSTDSDVWSYGMVLFEIWSVGQKPFSMNTNNEVLKLIQSGYVQCPPPGTPREIYSLMVECWNPEHGLRPKFARIFATLCGPVSKLLYWSPQDSQLSERTNELGASLEHGYKLHNDLTQKYKK